MKSLLKIAGIVACVAALGLNLQYAMDGYGIKSGKPYLNAFAIESSPGSIISKIISSISSIFSSSSSSIVSSKPPVTCGTDQTPVNYKEVCSYTPVILYVKTSGTKYSRTTGSFSTTYQEGFKGTVYSECTKNPAEQVDNVETKNC